MKPLTYFLGIFAFATNAGDLLLTLIGLSLGACELNPLLGQVGVIPFFLVKIFLPTSVIIGCLVIADKKGKNWVKGVHISLGLVGIVFLCAIVNNIIVLTHFL